MYGHSCSCEVNQLIDFSFIGLLIKSCSISACSHADQGKSHCQNTMQQRGGFPHPIKCVDGEIGSVFSLSWLPDRRKLSRVQPALLLCWTVQKTHLAFLYCHCDFYDIYILQEFTQHRYNRILVMSALVIRVMISPNLGTRVCMISLLCVLHALTSWLSFRFW